MSANFMSACVALLEKIPTATVEDVVLPASYESGKRFLRLSVDADKKGLDPYAVGWDCFAQGATNVSPFNDAFSSQQFHKGYIDHHRHEEWKERHDLLGRILF